MMWYWSAWQRLSTRPSLYKGVTTYERLRSSLVKVLKYIGSVANPRWQPTPLLWLLFLPILPIFPTIGHSDGLLLAEAAGHNLRHLSPSMPFHVNPLKVWRLRPSLSMTLKKGKVIGNITGSGKQHSLYCSSFPAITGICMLSQVYEGDDVECAMWR